MIETKKLKNKRLLIAFLIITALLSLSALIINQYNKYNEVEDRLIAHYSSKSPQSITLYKLFSTFSEAEYLFRMYSVNFDENDLNLYNLKLDTIKSVIDSLSSLPINNNLLKKTDTSDNTIALEYLAIKKQIDNLIIYSKDSLESVKTTTVDTKTRLKPLPSNDALLKDLNTNQQQVAVKRDTIVRKKGNFFNRLFNTKDDTIINNNNTIIEKTNEQNVVLRETITKIVTQNNKVNNANIRLISSQLDKLKTKERELITYNFNLLHSLKIGIEKLRELEFINDKKKQEADFLEYNKNTKTISQQLKVALSLMVFMIILIISYQRQVSIYERKLIREKEFVKQIAEEKTSVLANISHEIRAPINSLKGLVNLLKNNNGENIIDKEIIQSLDYDINVISSTINDILSLSKLESESLEIKNESINIHNLIEEVVGLHKYHASVKNLELVSNNSIPENQYIYSNLFRIKQILSNLITNAIKYTNKGKISINSIIDKNNTLLIQVVDTGIGISKEQGDQIFRKYYVADSKNKIGFGLGLYISKLLSEQLSGKLYFTSTVNKGTTFSFELPIQQVIESTPSQQECYTTKDIPSNLKIVFIDDSKINLFFIQQFFQGNKNISYYLDPEKALTFIKNNDVDIVITDLKMPKISGWDVLNTIKSDSEKSNIKVLASTAEPLLLEGKEFSFKFDGMINKPIKESELADKIINLS